MGIPHNSEQKQSTDEFPIVRSPRTARELERRQQDFFLDVSGDGRFFAPSDAEPDTDPSLPIVPPNKSTK